MTEKKTETTAERENRENREPQSAPRAPCPARGLLDLAKISRHVRGVILVPAGRGCPRVEPEPGFAEFLSESAVSSVFARTERAPEGPEKMSTAPIFLSHDPDHLRRRPLPPPALPRSASSSPLLRAVAARATSPRRRSRQADPARARRARPARLRADRHRQDGRVRAADPAAPVAERRGTAPAPVARAWSWRPRASWRRRSARASRPTAGTSRLSQRRDLRRRRPGPAGASARARRRHPGRHAGPPARPHATRATSTSSDVEVFVLDEADRMLDMGFIHDDPQDRRQAARAAPDAALLGDHAAATSRSWPTRSCAIRSRSRSTPVATTAERIDQCGATSSSRTTSARCSRTCSTIRP